MRWFKHFSDSLHDPFIQELLDEFSHLGYIAYFGLIETIAEQSKGSLTGKLRIKPRQLARKFRTTPSKLREVYDVAQSNGKLNFSIVGDYWHFEFDKLLDLQDNYHRNLQYDGKSLATNLLKEEKREEKEKDLDVTRTIAKENPNIKIETGPEPLESIIKRIIPPWEEKEGIDE